MTANYENIHKIFFIGIGGVSMSALASIAHSRGYVVGGSDRSDSATVADLRAQGITVFVGHDAKNVMGYDTVVYNAAIGADNPELAYAEKAGLTLIYRADFLTFLMGDYTHAVGIAGMHGKSTTSAMIAQMFLTAKRDPDILIGASLPSIGRSYRVGKTGTDFIFEACEYRDSFLSFRPTIAVVLNVEMDHPDYFKSIEQVRSSFRRYLQIPDANGWAVLNADDRNIPYCTEGIRASQCTFGIESPTADYRAQNIVFTGGHPTFDVLRRGELFCRVALHLTGMHNVYNALAAVAVGDLCGLSAEQIVQGLQAFTGAGRRMEYKGTFRPTGAAVYDDFGHHPSEVKTTINGAKQMDYERVFVVYQPHTFSRTAELLEDFRHAFSEADGVAFADIYAAREQNTYGISSKDIADGIPGAVYLPQWDDITAWLTEHTTARDMILVMGAGDISRYAQYIGES